MAYDTIRASGNNQYGQMSDVDRANFGSQQSAQDFILRKRLQDEALAKSDTNEAARLAAEQAMQDKALAAQQAMGGSFAERSALEDKRLDRSLSPQMEMLRQQEEHYKTQQEQGAPARELEAAKLRMRLGLYPKDGAAGSFQMTPELQKRAFEHELGLGESPDVAFQRGLSEKIISALAGRAAEGGDVGELQGILGAAKTGDLTKIPQNLAAKDIQSSQAIESYQGTPNYQFSLDDIIKTAQDVRRGKASPDEVVAKRDAMVNELVKRRVDPATAKSIINQQLDKALPGLMNDFMSGVTATLGAASIPFGGVGYKNVGTASETRKALGL